MSIPQIDEAHFHLVEAVDEVKKQGVSPIPITIVSVDDTVNGQLITFDALKWPKSTVVQRLRAAADFLESQ